MFFCNPSGGYSTASSDHQWNLNSMPNTWEETPQWDCKKDGKGVSCGIHRSFISVIGGEIVGSGYDSLTKQMISRVDNLRRGSISLSLKRQVISTSEGEDTPPRKRRLDTYGCINWQPIRLPPDTTSESQKHAQEELKTMYKERCHDTKGIENMMRATFFTQRKNIISGI